MSAPTTEHIATTRGGTEWHIAGEWFDVCSCNSPCPCTFAQPPTNNHCEVLWAYRINSGHYGGTPMAGLHVVLLAGFDGNLWGGAMLDCGFFFDARANEIQRAALVNIFTGKAGSWMSQFVPTHVRQVNGVEFADIAVEIDSKLERWSVKIDASCRCEWNADVRAHVGPVKAPSELQSTGKRGWPDHCAGDVGNGNGWPLDGLWLRAEYPGGPGEQAHPL